MTTKILVAPAKNAKGKIFRLVSHNPFGDHETFYVETVKSSYNGQMRGGLHTRWVWTDQCKTREEAEKVFAKRIGRRAA